MCVAAALWLCCCAAWAGSLPGTKTARDRAAWRALLHWPAACEADWRSVPEAGSGIEVLPAGAGRTLVLVGCDLAAYQGNTMLYLARAGSRPVGPLVLHLYGDPGNGRPRLAKQTVILGVLSFSRATGMLTVFDKFRGVGDCGIYSRFRLVGTRFVPVEARAKTACNGKPPFDAAHWPRLPVPTS